MRSNLICFDFLLFFFFFFSSSKNMNIDCCSIYSKIKHHKKVCQVVSVCVCACACVCVCVGGGGGGDV